MPATQVSSRSLPVSVNRQERGPPSNTSLITENQALRISCSGPCRSPTSASSRTRVIAFRAMPTTSRTVAGVLPSASRRPGTDRWARAT